MNKINLDEQTLRLYYVDQKLKLKEIGKLLGCCEDIVRRECKRFGFPDRKRVIIKFELLKRLLIDEEMIHREAANITETSIDLVVDWSVRYGLDNQHREIMGRRRINSIKTFNQSPKGIKSMADGKDKDVFC